MKKLIVLAAFFWGTATMANAQMGGNTDSISIKMPDTTSLPAGKQYTIDTVRKGILAGAIRRDWRVESESSGSARIMLNARQYNVVLVLDVVYDANGYTFKFVRGEGSTNINSHGPRWVNSLIDTIEVELLIANL